MQPSRYDTYGQYKICYRVWRTRHKKIVAMFKKEKRMKKCSTLKCAYCMIDVELNGYQVRLFFCKRRRKGGWNNLLATNTLLQFLEAYRIYQMRWAVKVSYKEQKELLGLEKCQSQNFNAQIGSVTLSMIQYNILSVVKRFNSYETIGALFGEAVTGTVEFSVTEKIWKMPLDAIFIASKKSQSMLQTCYQQSLKEIRLLWR